MERNFHNMRWSWETKSRETIEVFLINEEREKYLLFFFYKN